MFSSVSSYCSPTLHTLLCGNSNLKTEKTQIDHDSCTRIHNTIWKIQNSITNYDQLYFLFDFIMFNYFGIKHAFE